MPIPKLSRTVVAKKNARFKTAAGLRNVFYAIQQQLGPSSFVGSTCVGMNLHSSQYSIIFWGNHPYILLLERSPLFKIFKYSRHSVLVFGRSLGRWDSCVSVYAPVNVSLLMQREIAPTGMTESIPPQGMFHTDDEGTLLSSER